MDLFHKRAIAVRSQHRQFETSPTAPIKTPLKKQKTSLRKNFEGFIPLNIVIIDDDSSDVSLTKTLLESEMILNKPTIFTHPQKAFNFLTKTHEIMGEALPDLIMLDYNMPELTGLEVLKELRENVRTRLIPIIMLTNTDEEQVITESCKYNVNGFLKKPINVDVFLNLVRALPDFGFILGKKV